MRKLLVLFLPFVVVFFFGGCGASSVLTSRRSWLWATGSRSLAASLPYYVLPVRAADDSLLARAASLSFSEFYERHPYRVAGDVLPFLEVCASRGDAESVLLALDVWSERYPMFQTGPVKGKILEEALMKAAPCFAAEIGTFIGYSALRIARALPKKGKLVCVEASSDFADVARGVLAYAGQEATVVVAKGSDCAPLLREAFGKDHAMDFLFLDHAKEAYAPDLETLENARLVTKGTTVVADNVLYPGAPGYLDHVTTPAYATTLMPAPYESRGWETNWEPRDDAMSVSLRLI